MDEVSGLGNESVKLVGEEKYSAMTVSRDGSLNRVSQVAFFTILAEETWSRRIEFLPTAICTIVTKAGNGFSSRPYVDHLSKAWQLWFIKFWIMTAICQWTVTLHAFDWNYYWLYKWPAERKPPKLLGFLALSAAEKRPRNVSCIVSADLNMEVTQALIPLHCKVTVGHLAWNRKPASEQTIRHKSFFFSSIDLSRNFFPKAARTASHFAFR